MAGHISGDLASKSRSFRPAKLRLIHSVVSFSLNTVFRLLRLNMIPGLGDSGEWQCLISGIPRSRHGSAKSSYYK